MMGTVKENHAWIQSASFTWIPRNGTYGELRNCSAFRDAASWCRRPVFKGRSRRRTKEAVGRPSTSRQALPGKIRRRPACLVAAMPRCDRLQPPAMVRSAQGAYGSAEASRRTRSPEFSAAESWFARRVPRGAEALSATPFQRSAFPPATRA